jgi:hypothetical protein
MNAVQRTINLRAGQYFGYAKHRRPRTRYVTFPSLKKYASCRTNESSSVACPPLGVLEVSSSENLRRSVCTAPNSALGSPRDSSSEAIGDICELLEYVSENVESNETMDAVLDRTGDMQILLSRQQTMRGAIKMMAVCSTWHAPILL